MSAFVEAPPPMIEGGFRTTFFFSFFGRIVSLLGLIRKVPPPSALVLPDRSAGLLFVLVCGIDATVSVSTVITLVEASFARVLEGIRALNDFLRFGSVEGTAKSLDLPVSSDRAFELSIPPSVFTSFLLTASSLKSFAIGAGTLCSPADDKE